MSPSQFRRLLCVASLPLWMGSCSPAAPSGSQTWNSEFEPGAATDNPIIEGDKANGTYREAAFVGTHCSGTVIAPKVVLTGALCVRTQPTMKVKVPAVSKSKWWNGSTATFSSDMGYGDGDGVDVGLIFLDEEVPLPVFPIVSKDKIADGSMVVNVGRRGPLEEDHPDNYLYMSRPVEVHDGSESGYPNTYTAENLLQHGDMGGPSFLAGVTPHTIVAINSAIMDGAVLSRADIAWDWVEQSILDHGGHGNHEPEPGAGGGGCVYPSGPYGTSQGSTVAPTHSWQGYVAAGAPQSAIAMQDFFDCDGTKNINAVLVIESTVWCGACRNEAAGLQSRMQSSWGSAGVKVMQLLVENNSGGPGSPNDGAWWINNFGLKTVAVAADPNFLLRSPASTAYPYKVLIDPRTMKVVRTYTGGYYDSQVLQLAQSNQ